MFPNGLKVPDQVESCGPNMRREQLAYNEADDTREPAPPMCQQRSSVSWWATCALLAVTSVLVKLMQSCFFASPPQHNRGGAQAARLGPLPLLDERSVIATPHTDATRQRLSE